MYVDGGNEKSGKLPVSEVTDGGVESTSGHVLSEHTWDKARNYVVKQLTKPDLLMDNVSKNIVLFINIR